MLSSVKHSSLLPPPKSFIGLATGRYHFISMEGIIRRVEMKGNNAELWAWLSPAYSSLHSY